MHLLVIFGIALLVFGPKKLAELRKGIGEGITLSTLFFCNSGINHLLAGSSSIRNKKGGSSRFFTIFGGSGPVRGKLRAGRAVV
jgi:hypothetical protein